MRVGEMMSSNVVTVNADENIKVAAQLMASEMVGALPVTKNDQLVGIVTDRDLVVRGLAAANEGDCRVEDIMTSPAYYCFAAQDIKAVTSMFKQLKVRRAPVLNSNYEIVGILSLSDLMEHESAWAEARQVISEFQHSA